MRWREGGEGRGGDHRNSHDSLSLHWVRGGEQKSYLHERMRALHVGEIAIITVINMQISAQYSLSYPVN